MKSGRLLANLIAEEQRIKIVLKPHLEVWIIKAEATNGKWLLFFL
jgi:hypothetical protein